MIHTTREKSRNASGGSVGERGVLLPLAGGIAGGTATVLAAAKFHWHPVAVAAAAAVGGFALASSTKTPWMKQAAMGAAIGAGTLGGVTLAGQLMQPKAPMAATPRPAARSADGDAAFITRQELQDALAKTADSHKEQQKQQTCDLMTALREEIRRTVGTMDARKQSRSDPEQGPATFLHAVVPQKGASADDYMRDAYGDEPRDAADYDERNAYGDDDYMRDAYGDEYRDADERDGSGYDERDAVAYDDGDERDADFED